MWNSEDLVGLPVVRFVKELSSEALEEGRLDFTKYEFGAPDNYKNVYEPPHQVAMQFAFMLFAYRFCNDYFVSKDLEWAAKSYPFKGDQIDRLDLHLSDWEAYDNGWLTPSKEYDGYREQIMHVCARGRLGSTWPKVLHGAVVVYLIPHLDEKGTFEPSLVNRAINPVEGALDGYFVVPQVTLRTPDGEKVAINPGQSKRHALKGHDRKTREFIQANWAKIGEDMWKALGHKRRRGPNLISIETWSNWLFRRHFLRDSSDVIAVEENSTPSFVDERVRYLRHALDLQPKKAVRCDHGRPPLYY